MPIGYYFISSQSQGDKRVANIPSIDAEGKKGFILKKPGCPHLLTINRLVISPKTRGIRITRKVPLNRSPVSTEIMVPANKRMVKGIVTMLKTKLRDTITSARGVLPLAIPVHPTTIPAQGVAASRMRAAAKGGVWPRIKVATTNPSKG